MSEMWVVGARAALASFELALRALTGPHVGPYGAAWSVYYAELQLDLAERWLDFAWDYVDA